jgi:uncharacterized protein (TIGR02677 family)
VVRTGAMPDRNGQLRAFVYLNEAKTPLYRAIVRTFMDARARFVLNLRPQDIAEEIGRAANAAPTEGGQSVDATAVETALGQLKDWGNVEAYPDTADVATVEDFYRQRFLYQLTSAGESAERAVRFFEENVERPGELQTAALADIRELLLELVTLGETGNGAPIDVAKAHRALHTLLNRFDGLTTRAQQFMGTLQRRTILAGMGIDAFVAYKQRLIEYLERFIGELVVATTDIAGKIERIESSGLDRLLDAVAKRDLVDAVDPVDLESTAELRQRALWDGRWRGLRAWFFGTSTGQSQAEMLRARARAAIPALLAAVSGFHDRRVTRIDRHTDLRTLARWFAEAPDDRARHRLWRAAFALSPARHLRVDSVTLDLWEERALPAQTSWTEAPPLRFSPRLRATGRHARPGRTDRVIDTSAAREAIALKVRDEAAQIEAAARHLASSGKTRLSQVGFLKTAEFALFLDLLGDALAASGPAGEAIEVLSMDGTLAIRLEPIGNGAEAVVRTTIGDLRGPDCFVHIRFLAASENFTPDAKRPADRAIILDSIQP